MESAATPLHTLSTRIESMKWANKQWRQLSSPLWSYLLYGWWCSVQCTTIRLFMRNNGERIWMGWPFSLINIKQSPSLDKKVCPCQRYTPTKIRPLYWGLHSYSSAKIFSIVCLEYPLYRSATPVSSSALSTYPNMKNTAPASGQTWGIPSPPSAVSTIIH